MCFKDLRKRIGTQHELAFILHISQQAVANWEQGKSYPKASLLKKISILFNISTDEILEAIENSKKD